MTFAFIVMLLIVHDNIFTLLSTEYKSYLALCHICVKFDLLKFRKDPSITSQAIANYISVSLAVALSVPKTCTENMYRKQRH